MGTVDKENGTQGSPKGQKVVTVPISWQQDPISFFLLVTFFASFLINGEGDQTSGELTCLTDIPGRRGKLESDAYIEVANIPLGPTGKAPQIPSPQNLV